LEARVVPVRGGEVGRRVHLVLGRAATPIGKREGLLVPGLVPITVARLALDVDLDTRLGAALLVERRCIDGPWECDVGRTEQDRTGVSGLLVVFGRLFRV